MWFHDGSKAENQYGFGINRGLCSQLRKYAEHGLNMGHGAAHEVAIEMEKQFVEARLDQAFPFNSGSSDDYLKECEMPGGHTSNEKRIQWVRDHAAI